MVSFNFVVYFHNRFTTFPITQTLLYENLVLLVERTFGLARRHFILQIYDDRFRTYVEFDDEHLDWLRDRLPRTSVATIFGRIVSRRRINRHVLRPTISKDSSNDAQWRQQIIWLDKHIGATNNCRQLKRQFYNSTSIDHFGIHTDLFTNMIDTLIIDDDALFDTTGMRYFTAFENAERCLQFLTSRDLPLVTVLITSNDLGRHILPHLEHIDDVYVYVLQNDWHEFEWGLDYLDRLQMFDHDQTLLIRIIRDLARRYLDKASLGQKSPFDLSVMGSTLQYLQSARLLYQRADYLDKKAIASEVIENIDRQIDGYQQTVDKLIFELDRDPDRLSKEAL